MIPAQRNRVDGNADDTMRRLLDFERAAADDALYKHVSHVEDPDGPCSRGWTHDGPCDPGR